MENKFQMMKGSKLIDMDEVAKTEPLVQIPSYASTSTAATASSSSSDESYSSETVVLQGHSNNKNKTSTKGRKNKDPEGRICKDLEFDPKEDALFGNLGGYGHMLNPKGSKYRNLIKDYAEEYAALPRNDKGVKKRAFVNTKIIPQIRYFFRIPQGDKLQPLQLQVRELQTQTQQMQQMQQMQTMQTRQTRASAAKAKQQKKQNKPPKISKEEAMKLQLREKQRQLLPADPRELDFIQRTIMQALRSEGKQRKLTRAREEIDQAWRSATTTTNSSSSSTTTPTSTQEEDKDDDYDEEEALAVAVVVTSSTKEQFEEDEDVEDDDMVLEATYDDMPVDPEITELVKWNANAAAATTTKDTTSSTPPTSTATAASSSSSSYNSDSHHGTTSYESTDVIMEDSSCATTGIRTTTATTSESSSCSEDKTSSNSTNKTKPQKKKKKKKKPKKKTKLQKKKKMDETPPPSPPVPPPSPIKSITNHPGAVGGFDDDQDELEESYVGMTDDGMKKKGEGSEQGNGGKKKSSPKQVPAVAKIRKEEVEEKSAPAGKTRKRDAFEEDFSDDVNDPEEAPANKKQKEAEEEEEAPPPPAPLKHQTTTAVLEIVPEGFVFETPKDYCKIRDSLSGGDAFAAEAAAAAASVVSPGQMIPAVTNDSLFPDGRSPFDEEKNRLVPAAAAMNGIPRCSSDHDHQPPKIPPTIATGGNRNENNHHDEEIAPLPLIMEILRRTSSFGPAAATTSIAPPMMVDASLTRRFEQQAIRPTAMPYQPYFGVTTNFGIAAANPPMVAPTELEHFLKAMNEQEQLNYLTDFVMAQAQQEHMSSAAAAPLEQQQRSMAEATKASAGTRECVHRLFFPGGGQYPSAGAAAQQSNGRVWQGSRPLQGVVASGCRTMAQLQLPMTGRPAAALNSLPQQQWQGYDHRSAPAQVVTPRKAPQVDTPRQDTTPPPPRPPQATTDPDVDRAARQLFNMMEQRGMSSQDVEALRSTFESILKRGNKPDPEPDVIVIDGDDKDQDNIREGTVATGGHPGATHKMPDAN